MQGALCKGIGEVVNVGAEPQDQKAGSLAFTLCHSLSQSPSEHHHPGLLVKQPERPSQKIKLSDLKGETAGHIELTHDFVWPTEYLFLIVEKYT